MTKCEALVIYLNIIQSAKCNLQTAFFDKCIQKANTVGLAFASVTLYADRRTTTVQGRADVSHGNLNGSACDGS